MCKVAYIPRLISISLSCLGGMHDDKITANHVHIQMSNLSQQARLEDWNSRLVNRVILCRLIYAILLVASVFVNTIPRQSESFVNLDVVCNIAESFQALREVFLHRLHSGRHVAT